MKPSKTYFKKADNLCGMNRKGHNFVNLGKFKDETLINSMQI